MYGEYYCSVVVLDEVNKALDNVERIERIEATSWFVEKENARARYELAGYADTPFLSSRDATPATFFGSNDLMADMVDAKLFLNILNTLNFG